MGATISLMRAISWKTMFGGEQTAKIKKVHH